MKVNNYTIYQKQYSNFRDIDTQKTVYMIREGYRKIYESTIESDGEVISILDELYTIFNIHHPEDFKGHSLSIGDIIAINGEFYACMSLGWEKIKVSFDCVYEKIEHTFRVGEVLKNDNNRLYKTLEVMDGKVEFINVKTNEKVLATNPKLYYKILDTDGNTDIVMSWDFGKYYS